MDNLQDTQKRTQSTKQQDVIFSRSVKAGNRIYYFDARKTSKQDLYLTITESKKKNLDNGETKIETHKIYLFKEDFDKFNQAMTDVLDFIKKSNAEIAGKQFIENTEDSEEFTFDFDK